MPEITASPPTDPMSAPTAAPTATVVIGGTIAIDHVKTPAAEAQGLLGGSAAYAALAASFYCRPVGLIGIIGRDFPQAHLDMLEARGIFLTGVERSENESFTWSGEYHENMNERTTHRVGLNVLENWRVRVPSEAAASTVVVLANMSPDNQLEMLAQCGLLDRAGIAVSSDSSHPQSSIPNPQSSSSRFVIADTMDLWISIANERLHEVLPHLDLFVLNEGEARELAGSSNLVRAGRILLDKGPRHVVIKLGEFGAMLFSASSSSQSSIPNPQSPISTGFFRCSAWPLESVADPTGAGDTFLGAIAGYLAAQGPPPYSASALRQAVIQGSILASFTCEAFSTQRLESLQPAELSARLAQFREATEWGV
jgi:sugar/nucleoside kinase (ribokinase family)